MKKILILISLTVLLSGQLLLIAGCSENSNWQAFGQGLKEYSQQQQNITNQQNMQLRENAREINRQLQQKNSNYWQEQRAQQEYWQNIGK